MNEHSFIRSIHRKLPEDIYVWKINDNYQGGVADAYYSRRGGRDLWIEYKYLPTLPKRPGTVVQFGISELQKLWLADRHKDGRSVAVIVGSPQGCLILTDRSWERQHTMAEFIGSAVAASEVVAYIKKATTAVHQLHTTSMRPHQDGTDQSNHNGRRP